MHTERPCPFPTYVFFSVPHSSNKFCSVVFIIFDVFHCNSLIPFFTFISDFVIFEVVKWMFLIFHDFQFPTIFHVLQWTFLNYPTFSVFLALFHVLKCVFLIFRDFQFSRHIPGPTVCISHFSRFSGISSFFKSPSGCFSVSIIFSFLPYSMCYSGHF